MSVYSILAGLLAPIPPENFTVTDAAGNTGTVTQVEVSLAASNSPLDLHFACTIGGGSHTFVGTVDLHGTATIAMDGVAKTNHPVINAGIALHWEPMPVSFVIVKWRFVDTSSAQQEYRFEGKRP